MIIQQGAEATISKEGISVVKDRLKKSYRHPDLDKRLIKRRTKSEAKLLSKAAALISAPEPTLVESDKIEMPFIPGKKLSEALESEDYKSISKIIGKQIATLHDSDIIHGDLTTSNMILSEDKIYFIDFGLGYISHRIEDKAVDLHLIKQALEAKHPTIHETCINTLLSSYNSKDRDLILKQLEKVESRGRYKKGS